MNPEIEDTKRRRRTCVDRFRHRFQLVRRRRSVDPSFKVVQQLLALFGFIVLVAPLPAVGMTWYPTPPRYDPADVARRIGVPRRYVDDFVRLGRVPLPRLIHDIRFNPFARGDAILELKRCMPAQTWPWLNHVEKENRWNELTRCFGRDAEDQVRKQVLMATIRWLEELVPGDMEPAEDGKDAKIVMRPRGKMKDPDDDRGGPRP